MSFSVRLELIENPIKLIKQSGVAELMTLKNLRGIKIHNLSLSTQAQTEFNVAFHRLANISKVMD